MFDALNHCATATEFNVLSSKFAMLSSTISKRVNNGGIPKSKKSFEGKEEYRKQTYTENPIGTCTKTFRKEKGVKYSKQVVIDENDKQFVTTNLNGQILNANTQIFNLRYLIWSSHLISAPQLMKSDRDLYTVTTSKSPIHSKESVTIIQYRKMIQGRSMTMVTKHKLIPSVYGVYQIHEEKVGYSGPMYIAIRSGKTFVQYR